MFFEAILFVTEQRGGGTVRRSVRRGEGTELGGLKAFPSFVYTRILWPMDIVLVDCHECYGRKILEWSMCIKIQYLDSIGIPQKKKRIGNGLCISTIQSHWLLFQLMWWIHKRYRLVKRSLISAVHLLLGNQLKSPLSEGLLNSRCPDHEYCSRHLEVWSFWGVLSFWFLRWYHPQQRKTKWKLMIKFNKNGQGEDKILLNMNCRFIMILITKMENH